MTLKERFQSANSLQKILIILILLILLLVLGLLIYFIVIRLYQPAVVSKVNENINQNTNQDQSLSNLNASISSTYLSPESLTQEKDTQQREQTALLVATSFAERFGSFSNQSDFANFSDLDIFMTESMKQWIAGYIEKSRKEYPLTGDYYGIETRVISSTVNSLDETLGMAEILFVTQRSEFQGSDPTPRVFYQDILIKLVKQNTQWLVNGAYWK